MKKKKRSKSKKRSPLKTRRATGSIPMARSRTKTVYRKRGFGNINLKKEATHAALGSIIGLGIKYGGTYLAQKAGYNGQMAELSRRAANVAAAYAGKGSGELAYQAVDGILNTLITTSGGTAMGTGPGEAA